MAFDVTPFKVRKVERKERFVEIVIPTFLDEEGWAGELLQHWAETVRYIIQKRTGLTVDYEIRKEFFGEKAIADEVVYYIPANAYDDAEIRAILNRLIGGMARVLPALVYAKAEEEFEKTDLGVEKI